jgi:hypothetical protein
MIAACCRAARAGELEHSAQLGVFQRARVQCATLSIDRIAGTNTGRAFTVDFEGRLRAQVASTYM